MMQEWIKIFLTGFVSFVVSLSVALILRNKDRKEAAKIHKDDSKKAARKRKEDRKWISKKFAESKKQTIALKEQAKSTKDLAKWSEQYIKILLRSSRKYIESEACTNIIDQKSGLLYSELTLKVRNLTKKDILIKNIQITEHCSFEFLENACRFDEGRSDKWRSDLSKEKDPVVIKRTTPKRISLDPKEVKSNATLSFTLDLFRITANECIVLYFLLSISESEYNAHNIVNCTLEYPSPENPDELITDYFSALETPYKHLYCD
ncbi:hypothetical protein [Bartonella raoultii]|uniref:hypothetical protein n=1 Tax=Bartonella raoultii TaxID=1457020 RepID=UPI001ABBCF7C|nr:hypothetical protein [Bartonella raoultii]